MEAQIGAVHVVLRTSWHAAHDHTNRALTLGHKQADSPSPPSPVNVCGQTDEVEYAWSLLKRYESMPAVYQRIFWANDIAK